MPVCEEMAGVSARILHGQSQILAEAGGRCGKVCGCGGQSEKVESDRQADPHGAGAAGEKPKDGEDLLAAQLAAGKADEATGISAEICRAARGTACRP